MAYDPILLDKKFSTDDNVWCGEDKDLPSMEEIFKLAGLTPKEMDLVFRIIIECQTYVQIGKDYGRNPKTIWINWQRLKKRMAKNEKLCELIKLYYG